MISLIVISCIVAAFTPIITKKLSSGVVSIGGGGGGFGGDPSEAPLDAEKCKEMFGENCLACTINGCTKCSNTCSDVEERLNAYCECVTDCRTIDKDGMEFCQQCIGTIDSKVSCSLCDPGYGRKGGTCVECLAPTVSDGKSPCIKCINGFYQDEDKQVECKPCGFGYYCDSNGNRNKCPDDKKLTSTEYATSINECEECPAGWICKSGKDPVRCPQGQIADKQNNECKPCPAGFRCKDDQAFECESDYYSPEGQTECKFCAINCTRCDKYSGACEQCTNRTVLKASGFCGIPIENQTQCDEFSQRWKNPYGNAYFKHYWKDDFGDRHSANLLKYVETNSYEVVDGYKKYTINYGMCVMRVNAGDLGLPINGIDPTPGSSGACIRGNATFNTSETCENMKYDDNGFDNSYGGCKRTVCNWYAANEICSSYNREFMPDEVGTPADHFWRLPNNYELGKWNDTEILYSESDSLNLCDAAPHRIGAYCDWSNAGECPSGVCYPSILWGSADPLESGPWIAHLTQKWYVYSSDYPKEGYSVRCVLE